MTGWGVERGGERFLLTGREGNIGGWTIMSFRILLNGESLVGAGCRGKEEGDYYRLEG